jgi:hypothetical protein
LINNKKLSFLIFSFFFVINVISSGGHFDAHDGVEYFLVTESMALKHSAKLYPDVPSIEKLHFNISNSINDQSLIQTGKPYQDSALKPTYIAHCCLLSAIALPFYYVANFFSVSPIHIVGLFVNPLVLALISVVIFHFSLEIYRSKKIAFVLSLIFGVCSFAWPYVTTLVPQPLQTLLIITSAFFIYISIRPVKTNNSNNSIHKDTRKKRIYFAGLAGLFLGFSVFAYPPSVFVIPGFIAYTFLMTKHNKKTLSSFLIVLGTVLFFVGLVNYWRFGSFTDFGYGFQQSLLINNRGSEGLLGLLISPGFGLIFFFPIAVLVPIAFVYMYKENKGLSLLFAYILVVIWLYFGTLSFGPLSSEDPGTWNGEAWGPRYFIIMLPFLTLLSGTLLHRLQKLHSKRRLILKFSITLLCIAGFFVNLLGLLVWYQYAYGYGWTIERLSKYDQTFHQTHINSMDLMTWNPHYSPIVLHMKVLTSDFVSKIPNEFIGSGLVPCSYDLYIFCKFGIVPILLASGIITVLSILIMTETSDKYNTIYLVVKLKNYLRAKKA